MTGAELRKIARQAWTFHKFGPADGAVVEEVDVRFWLAVPLEQRAALAWTLSLETFGLAEADDPQRRLPRSDYRLIRR